MMNQKPQIGFIGLGSMGYPMAHNLVRAGLSVRGYDIRTEVTIRFEQAGGLFATSPAQAAERAEILIMVGFDSTAEQREAAI